MKFRDPKTLKEFKFYNTSHRFNKDLYDRFMIAVEQDNADQSNSLEKFNSKNSIKYMHALLKGTK